MNTFSYILHMPVSHPDSFIYSGYQKLLVRSSQSKHIPANLKGQRSDLFNSLANKVGYQCSRIGTRPGGLTLTQEEDVAIVQTIAKSQKIRPVKFCITKDKKIWADNTHNVLAALLLYGENVVIKNIPHFIVDLRGRHPVVFNCPDSLINPNLGISINAALYIQEKLDNGWRPENISFTIGELFEFGGYNKNYSRDTFTTLENKVVN